MSVYSVDIDIAKYLYTNLVIASTHRVCDEHYLRCVESMTPEEIKTHISTWFFLNEWTYVAMYGKKKYPIENRATFDGLYTLIEYSFTKKISAFQLYKYVQCFLYNIDTKEIEIAFSTGSVDFPEGANPITPEALKSVELLKQINREMTASIINSNPLYQAAAWGDTNNIQFNG